MTSVAEGCPANQCDGCGECSTPMRARGWHGDQDVFGVDGGESAGESGRPEGVLMGARARSAWQRSSPTAAEEESRHLPLRLPVAFPRPFWRPPPQSCPRLSPRPRHPPRQRPQHLPRRVTLDAAAPDDPSPICPLSETVSPRQSPIYAFSTPCPSQPLRVSLLSCTFCHFLQRYASAASLSSFFLSYHAIYPSVQTLQVTTLTNHGE